jgi:hypothetical protein
MTTSAISMFDFKTVYKTKLIESQKTGQKIKYLSPTESQNNFLSCIILSYTVMFLSIYLLHIKWTPETYNNILIILEV